MHKARPFFGELVETMTAGPVVVQVLEAEDAIKKYRDVLGATDPAKAAPGTIRKEFARLARREFGAWLGRSGDRRWSRSRNGFRAMKSSDKTSHAQAAIW